MLSGTYSSHLDLKNDKPNPSYISKMYIIFSTVVMQYWEWNSRWKKRGEVKQQVEVYLHQSKREEGCEGPA